MPKPSLVRRFRRSTRFQVIGICRFSYPALGGFQVVHETPEERARFLYDPQRLDARFRLFEAFTLPSLRAQTDPDFTYLIVIGDNLPKDRRDQLHDLTRDMPQVVIEARAPGRHRTVMADAINSHRRQHQATVQFRLDDDDAVGVGFVAALRHNARQSRHLFADSAAFGITFTDGYYVRASAAGILAEAAQRLYLSMAIGVAVRRDSPLTVMNFAHHALWQAMPTVTRNAPDMWVRGVNDHNDSGEKMGSKVELLSPQDEAKFQRAFGISARRVRQIWGG